MAEQILTVRQTGYGYGDNDQSGPVSPGYAIAFFDAQHPEQPNPQTKCWGAAYGDGTFGNPYVVASDPRWLPKNTKIYVDFVTVGGVAKPIHRYFVMLDTCAQCITDWGRGIRHIDLWVGGNPQDPNVDAAASSITGNARIIVNPVATYPVTKGVISGKESGCVSVTTTTTPPPTTTTTPPPTTTTTPPPTTTTTKPPTTTTTPPPTTTTTPPPTTTTTPPPTTTTTPPPTTTTTPPPTTTSAPPLNFTRMDAAMAELKAAYAALRAQA
jgi:hypothetical protein